MPDSRPFGAVRRAAAVTAAAGLLATGCTSAKALRDKTYDSFRSMMTSSYHDPDPDAKMARADELFQQGNYAEAQKLFADLADNEYNPVLVCEKSRFMEAECLRLRGKLFEAVAHYNRMLNDFPGGAYREKGCLQMYDIAYGWLKDGTLKDIEAELNGTKAAWWEAVSVPNFLDASKPTLDQEGEAVKYLEAVHTHDLTGPVADKALFWCGYVNFYRGRYEEADYFFSQLVETQKDSPLWKEALRLAVIAKNNSTGGAVYDSSKASEALLLVHRAEAAVPEFVKDPDKSAWLTRQKLAVRMQLAEKDFAQARYYERTHHPASAYFYYELVTRRYPGTKYADEAAARLEALKQVKAQMDADRAAGRPSTTWDAVRQEWAKMTGADAAAPPPVPADAAGPNGPPPEPNRLTVGQSGPPPSSLPPVPGGVP